MGGIVLWFIFFILFPAMMGKDPNEILKTAGIWAVIFIGVGAFARIFKGKDKKQITRVGEIDKWLFDKGATYKNGYEYEQYVAYLLEKKGYKDVLITQKSGDYGADIICRDKDGDKIAVQCKYYSKPVGYRAVEEALGAMHYYGCNASMVVTNNTYTKQAITAANRAGVKLMERVK